MLPVLDAFKEKYKLEKLIVVADSGLFSKRNVEALQARDYEFILGARIKNESQSLKEEILKLRLENGQSKVLKKDHL